MTWFFVSCNSKAVRSDKIKLFSFLTSFMHYIFFILHEICTCLFKCVFCLKPALQKGQQNSLSKKWTVFICRTAEYLVANIFPHILHLKPFLCSFTNSIKSRQLLSADEKIASFDKVLLWSKSMFFSLEEEEARFPNEAAIWISFLSIIQVVCTKPM